MVLSNYKTAKGLLKGLKKFANSQEISILNDFENYDEENQQKLYELIAGIENDISEINDIQSTLI